MFSVGMAIHLLPSTADAMSRYKQFPVVDPDGVEGAVLAISRFLDDDRGKACAARGRYRILCSGELLVPQADGSYRLTVPVRKFSRNNRGWNPQLSFLRLKNNYRSAHEKSRRAGFGFTNEWTAPTLSSMSR